MLHSDLLTVLCGLALLFTAASGLTEAKDRQDERIKSVTSIFVAGNNQAAEGARRTIENSKTCFTLASRATDADAVLEIGADTQRGSLGDFGQRAWIASGTLTLKSGDLVWSHSERFSDAPFMSGGKTAGKLLLLRLARESGCKDRRK